MFRYTPNRKLFTEFIHERNRGWNKVSRASYDYIWMMSRFKDYSTCCAMLEHWEHTEFYYPTKRKDVPVIGFLIPVEYFDEIKC